MGHYDSCYEADATAHKQKLLKQAAEFIIAKIEQFRKDDNLWELEMIEDIVRHTHDWKGFYNLINKK